jgi:tetratricopeptide (TPR) repeat protein
MRLKWRFAIYLMFLSCLCTPKAHSALPDTWEKAAKEYRKGDYPAAAAQYEKLIHAGYSDPALFYNLGKCYAQQGKKGHAILALERALRLAPRSQAIQITLEKVRGTLTDQITPEKGTPLDTWLLQTTSGNWAFAAIFFVWLGSLIWFAGRLKIGLLKRKRNGLAVSSIALGLLLISIAFYADLKKNNWRQAILLQQESIVFLAPDNLSPELRRVHEGTKLYILEELNEWAKIQLENGDEGWIQKRSFVQIAPFGKREG